MSSSSSQTKEDNYELKCQPTDDMNKLTDKKNNVLIEENKTLNVNKNKGFKEIQKIILIVFLLFIFALIFGYLIYNYIIVKLLMPDTGPNVLTGGKRLKR